MNTFKRLIKDSIDVFPYVVLFLITVFTNTFKLYKKENKPFLSCFIATYIWEYSTLELYWFSTYIFIKNKDVNRFISEYFQNEKEQINFWVFKTVVLDTQLFLCSFLYFFFFWKLFSYLF